MMKSHTIVFQLAQHMNRPFVQCIHGVYATHHRLLSGCLSYHMDCYGITVLGYKQPLFYLLTAPKHKSSDTGNLDMLKRNCKVFPESEKVAVLDNWKRKRIMC